jgi:hypothetical protein
MAITYSEGKTMNKLIAAVVFGMTAIMGQVRLLVSHLHNGINPLHARGKDASWIPLTPITLTVQQATRT